MQNTVRAAVDCHSNGVFSDLLYISSAICKRKAYLLYISTRVRNFRRFSFWATPALQKSRLVLNFVAFGFADYTPPSYRPVVKFDLYS